MITQIDLARRLRLSQQTVSLCYSRPELVAEKTRDRVLSYANEIGYVLNSSARAMRRGRNNAIGLLLSTDIAKSTIPHCLFHALREECRASNLHLVVGDLPDEALNSEAELPRILREWAVDGLLVNYTHHVPPRMFELISSNRIPSVWLNHQLPFDCVYPDDLAAARLATDELIRLGHKRIAYHEPAFDQDHYSATDRRAGYTAAMVAAGLQPRVLRAPNTMTQSERRQYTEAWLREADRPTAILTYNSDDAALVPFIAIRLGLEVPRDLSIVTFHSGPGPAAVAGVAFGTLRVPMENMARDAVLMLQGRIERVDEPAAARSLPFVFTLGETIAPPPSEAPRAAKKIKSRGVRSDRSS